MYNIIIKYIKAHQDFCHQGIGFTWSHNSCSVSSVCRKKYINKESFHSQLFCQLSNEMKPKQAHYQFDSKETSDTEAIKHTFPK